MTNSPAQQQALGDVNLLVSSWAAPCHGAARTCTTSRAQLSPETTPATLPGMGSAGLFPALALQNGSLLSAHLHRQQIIGSAYLIAGGSSSRAVDDGVMVDESAPAMLGTQQPTQQLSTVTPPPQGGSPFGVAQKTQRELSLVESQQDPLPGARRANSVMHGMPTPQVASRTGDASRVSLKTVLRLQTPISGLGIQTVYCDELGECPEEPLAGQKFRTHFVRLSKDALAQWPVVIQLPDQTVGNLINGIVVLGEGSHPRPIKALWDEDAKCWIFKLGFSEDDEYESREMERLRQRLLRTHELTGMDQPERLRQRPTRQLQSTLELESIFISSALQRMVDLERSSLVKASSMVTFTSGAVMPDQRLVRRRKRDSSGVGSDEEYSETQHRHLKSVHNRTDQTILPEQLHTPRQLLVSDQQYQHLHSIDHYFAMQNKQRSDEWPHREDPYFKSNRSRGSPARVLRRSEQDTMPRNLSAQSSLLANLPSGPPPFTDTIQATADVASGDTSFGFDASQLYERRTDDETDVELDPMVTLGEAIH